MFNELTGLYNAGYQAAYGADTKKKSGSAKEGAKAEGDAGDLLAQFQHRIKVYWEEQVSGVSEEDREKMNDEIKKYLKDHGLADKKEKEWTKDEIKGFQEFLKGLMEKYKPKDKTEDLAGVLMQKGQNARQYRFMTEEAIENIEEKKEKTGVV